MLYRLISETGCFAEIMGLAGVWMFEHKNNSVINLFVLLFYILWDENWKDLYLISIICLITVHVSGNFSCAFICIFSSTLRQSCAVFRKTVDFMPWCYFEILKNFWSALRLMYTANNKHQLWNKLNSYMS